MTAVLMGIFAVSLAIGFFGDEIKNKIPKAFKYDNYSIRLTSAFDEYNGEWESSDVTVYCFMKQARSSADTVPYTIQPQLIYRIQTNPTELTVS